MTHLLNLPDNKRQYVLYHCPEMEELATKLAHAYPGTILKKSTIDFEQFPDKTPNMFIHNIEAVENRHVLFLGSFNGFKNKYMHMAICLVFAESFLASLTILYPFFDTATMERVDKEGQVATANIDSWMLSSLPMTAGGPTKVVIYDPHTLGMRFYLHDGAQMKIATAIPIFKKVLSNYDPKTVAIAFPDDGAAKRFGSMFPEYEDNIIVCAKVRDGDERVVTIKDGNPKGYHVFIVDDLVQSGGTLIQCKNALMKRGATKVSAFVTHVIFPKNSWTKFMPGGEGDGFDRFYATDTCPKMAKTINGQGPFEILSIGENLMECL